MRVRVARHGVPVSGTSCGTAVLWHRGPGCARQEPTLHPGYDHAFFATGHRGAGDSEVDRTEVDAGS